MAEERKEKQLNYLALTTVIFAVCATRSTFKCGGQSTKSVLSQSQASNQWAYYQAKSIKGYLYKLQQEKLELELKTFDPRTRKLIGDDYQKKNEGYAKKIKEYDEQNRD